MNNEGGIVSGLGSDSVYIKNASDVSLVNTSGGSDSVVAENSNIKNIITQDGIDSIILSATKTQYVDSGTGKDNLFIKDDSFVHHLKAQRGSDAIVVENSTTDKIEAQSGVVEVQNSNLGIVEGGTKGATVITDDGSNYEVGGNVENITTENVVTSEGAINSTQDINAFEMVFSQYLSSDNLQYTIEQQEQIFTIDFLQKNLDMITGKYNNAELEGGLITDIYNLRNNLINAGIPQEEVDFAISQQNEMLQALEASLNGQNGLSFEECFKNYTGVEYNQKNIEEYAMLSQTFQNINSSVIRAQQIQNSQNLQDVYNSLSQIYGSQEKAVEELNKYLNNIAQIGNEQSKLSINSMGQFEIKIPTPDNSYQIRTYNLEDVSNANIIFDMKNMTSEIAGIELERALKNCELQTGKTYNELAIQLETSQVKAMGHGMKVSDLINQYCENQANFKNELSMVITTAGIATTATGAIVTCFCPPAAGVGLTLMSVGAKTSMVGMFSNNALDLVDNLTSENGLTAEELKNNLKETATELGYLALGQGINSVAEFAQTGSLEVFKNLNLSDKTTQTLSWLVEGSTDMGLSVLSDVIITGDMNFDSNSRQVLMGILSGVARAKVNSIKANALDDAFNKADQGNYDNAVQTLKDAGFSEAEIRSRMTSFEYQRAYELYSLTGDEVQLREFLNKSNIIADTEGVVADSIITKVKYGEVLFGNYDKIMQAGDNSCAIASVLNGIADKPMLIQALANKFEYIPENGTYKFSAFGDEFEVKLESGENLLQKMYDAYRITYTDDIEGDFVTRVFDEIFDGASDIVVKPNSDSIQFLKNYSNDENSILTFNTNENIQGLMKGHSYTVLGIDEQGNIKLQDPVTLKEVTVTKEKYENLDCRVEGKTYLDSGIIDGSNGRLVAGLFRNNTKPNYNNPSLDRYISGTSYGRLDHGSFVRNNDLLKSLSVDFDTDSHGYFIQKPNGTYKEGWRYHNFEDQTHSAWKMHIFANNEADWQKLIDTCGRYLNDHGINWKTFGADWTPENFGKGTVQAGKAFTFYPRSEAEMEIIARDLDYIIRVNNLCISNSSISGDNSLGSTGRLFYRYEYQSGFDINKVYDLNYDYKEYDRKYDSNKARQNYYATHPRQDGCYHLAKDMSASSDPWLNFDPANPNSRPGQNSYNNSWSNYNQNYNRQGQYYSHGNSAMQPGEYLTQTVYFDDTCVFKIGNTIVDFGKQEYSWIFNNLKDGQSIVIGRNPSYSNIIINDPTVSGQHIRITRQGNRFVIADLQSRNGTKFLGFTA
ncbi:FHA domain-containing protein [bacterium]|nr:FHA domain-containing protein [bacterium]